MRLRIYEHIAPVLCITSALNNSIIISGGEDSSIIITSLANGKVVMYRFRRLYMVEKSMDPLDRSQVLSSGKGS